MPTRSNSKSLLEISDICMYRFRFLFYSDINCGSVQAITFHKCENLKVRNLVLVNSQQMHMAFTNCDSVRVSRLRLVAPASSPNTDGVHISSSTDVEVKDSVFQTGQSQTDNFSKFSFTVNR